MTDGSCDTAMTTADMQVCLDKRYHQVDQELNRVYNQLMSELSHTRQATFREAQRAWILFRDKSAAFSASETEGGTMSTLIYLSVLTSMTEKRVGELQALLQGMTAR
jgi:uncharacterized protein YecT (DUF1311 family)